MHTRGNYPHPSESNLMNESTHQQRIDQLYTLVYTHPHREELLQLMEEQLIDDVDFVPPLN